MAPPVGLGVLLHLLPCAGGGGDVVHTYAVSVKARVIGDIIVEVNFVNCQAQFQSSQVQSNLN